MFKTKFLLLAVGLMATSILASASTVTVNCVAFPTQFSGSVGSGSVSCAGWSTGLTGDPLAILTGANLNLFADYTFGATSANDIRLTFTVAAPAGVTWAASSTFIDVFGGFSSSSTSPAVPLADAATAGVTAANFASAFNVGVAADAPAGPPPDKFGGKR